MSSSGKYLPPVLPKASVASAAASYAGSKVSAATENTAIESEAARQRRLEEEEAASRRWTTIVGGVGSAAIITALVAIYIEASFIATLAFLFPLGTAPYCIHQRRKLNRLPTLNHEINEIRMYANRLSAENDVLTQNVDSLQREVSRLSVMDDQLEQHAQRQGRDVNQLRQLVKENGEIIRKQKKLQETKVMQNLLTAIIKSDGDSDFHINDDELETLILRMKNMPGVKFDETRLRKQFRASMSNSMDTLAQLTKEVLEAEKLELAKNNE